MMTLLGTVESWINDPASLGPVYPFVGSELLMFALCVAFFVLFMIWKLRTESEHYRRRASQLREAGALTRAVDE